MHFPADTLLRHPLLHPPPCETTGEETEISLPPLLHMEEGKGGGAVSLPFPSASLRARFDTGESESGSACWDACTTDLRRQP